MLDAPKVKVSNNNVLSETTFQHFDYEMQKHITMMSWAVSGNMNAKYVYGYRYAYKSNQVNDINTCGAYYWNNYETGQLNRLGIGSTTSLYATTAYDREGYDPKYMYSSIGDEKSDNETRTVFTGDDMT